MSSFNKFDILQDTETKRGKKTSTKSPKNNKNNNNNNNEPHLIFTSFDDILNGIGLRPHNNCRFNSCCSIHCDIINSSHQSEYLRISLHLSNLSLTDAQLITLTNSKIIPVITNYFTQNKNILQKLNNRITIALYLNENCLNGLGIESLLQFISNYNLRITTLQLFKNIINDIGCKTISDSLYNIKYPPNEIILSHNKITNIGFNYFINLIKYRNENNNKLLSYPIQLYRIKFAPIFQNIAPLWLRCDNNYIDCDIAKEYLNENNINVCFAMNNINNNNNKNNARLYCDSIHCIKGNNCIKYYNNKINEYKKHELNKKKQKKYGKYINKKCYKCIRERKKQKSKHKNNVILCKNCKEKAKIIDQKNKQNNCKIDVNIVEKVNKIMENNNISVNDKLKQMEKIAAQMENDENNNENNENENNNEINNKYFGNEFFIEVICDLPNDYKIPMVHLAKFNQQSREAVTNEKVKQAQKLIKIKIKKNEILDEKSDKINSNKLDKPSYENSMIKNSETPLFIMCDTCSILRMVALTKKSAMNYWETMLTHVQKIEYILYYTTQDCIKKEKYLNNCEMYQRKLRIEILPILQLHLNTDEIKEIGNKLMKVPFKKLISDKKKNKTSTKHTRVYNHKDTKYKNIIICQMYRFVALYPNKLPLKNSENDSKHIWQQLLQKYVFNEIGLHCPQELMPKFITEIKKYGKQYLQQSELENAKVFTLNTLIEKSEENQFGFNIIKSNEQTCLLIPHTVTLELEHIKTRTGNKSKGDLWRVQKLCGSSGLLELLCKKSGCDILGNEHGEAHLKYRHGNNDYTIISIAQYYSKLLNKENNFGFVLITNDKVMYTIASGKNIPVASLNVLNKQLQIDQINGGKNENEIWNASYLRKVFIKVGFVGGFVKKHLINHAINTLKNSKNNNNNKSTDINGNVNGIDGKDNDNETIEKELEMRRNEIANFMSMEQLYAFELLKSVSLTNDLIITLKDILENRDSTEIMRYIYKNKVNHLEQTVKNSHLKWSQIITAYQNKYATNMSTNLDANMPTNNNSVVPDLEPIFENENGNKNENKNKCEEIKEEIIEIIDENENKCEEIETIDEQNMKHFETGDDIPEINRFHGEDNAPNYVNINDFSGDDSYRKPKSKSEINNDIDDDEDSDIPPPLNEDDQQKLLEIKRNISNKKEKENGGNISVNDNKKWIWNEEVPLIGGFLAGEELFTRQADKIGFEEEVVVMTEET